MTVPSRKTANTVFKSINNRIVCAAQARRRINDALKYRLQMELRAANNTQNVARSGLVLERLAKLSSPSLHLLEQPRVLDGNDGLVGEGLEQIDLLVGEGTDLSASDGNGAYCFARANYWHCQVGAVANMSRVIAVYWVLIGFGLQIRNMYGSPVEDGTSVDKPAHQLELSLWGIDPWCATSRRSPPST
jgi:hypothetical protein